MLVGGDRWVIDLGRALRSAGLQVLMWAGLEEQREAIRQAGLELAPGELLPIGSLVGGAGAELAGRLRRLRGRGACDPQVPPSGDERQTVEQRH